MAKSTNDFTDRKRNFLLLILPFIVWACLIFTVSSIPGTELPKVSLWQWDKLAHFGEYTIFSFLLYRCFYLGRIFSNAIAWKICVLGGIIYAGLDEIHQLLIPFRVCTWQDFVADILGVIIGVVVTIKYFSRKYHI